MQQQSRIINVTIMPHTYNKNTTPIHKNMHIC